MSAEQWKQGGRDEATERLERAKQARREELERKTILSESEARELDAPVPEKREPREVPSIERVPGPVGSTAPRSPEVARLVKDLRRERELEDKEKSGKLLTAREKAELRAIKIARELEEKEAAASGEGAERDAERDRKGWREYFGPLADIEEELEGLHGEFDRQEARKATEEVAEAAGGSSEAQSRAEQAAEYLDPESAKAGGGEGGDGGGPPAETPPPQETEGREEVEASAEIPPDLAREASRWRIWGRRAVHVLAGVGFGMGARMLARTGVRAVLGCVNLLGAAGGLGVGVLAGGLGGALTGWGREWMAYRRFVTRELGMERGRIVERIPAEQIAERMRELEDALEQARNTGQRRIAEAISDRMRYLRIASLKGERGMNPYQRAMEILEHRREELENDQDRRARLLRDMTSRGSRSLFWSRRVRNSAIMGAVGGAVGALIVDWIATGSLSEGIREWLPGGDEGGAEAAPAPGEETAPGESAPSGPEQPGEGAKPAPVPGGETAPGESSPPVQEQPGGGDGGETEPPDGSGEGQPPAEPEKPNAVVPGPLELFPREDIPLAEGSNPWEVVKEKLTEALPEGRTPTDAEIMYVTRELARQSDINVPSWGVSGSVLHTEIPPGYGLKFSSPEVQDAFRDVLEGKMGEAPGVVSSAAAQEAAEGTSPGTEASASPDAPAPVQEPVSPEPAPVPESQEIPRDADGSIAWDRLSEGQLRAAAKTFAGTWQEGGIARISDPDILQRAAFDAEFQRMIAEEMGLATQAEKEALFFDLQEALKERGMGSLADLSPEGGDVPDAGASAVPQEGGTPPVEQPAVPEGLNQRELVFANKFFETFRFNPSIDSLRALKDVSVGDALRMEFPKDLFSGQEQGAIREMITKMEGFEKASDQNVFEFFLERNFQPRGN